MGAKRTGLIDLARRRTSTAGKLPLIPYRPSGFRGVAGQMIAEYRGPMALSSAGNRPTWVGRAESAPQPSKTAPPYWISSQPCLPKTRLRTPFLEPPHATPIETGRLGARRVPFGTAVGKTIGTETLDWMKARASWIERNCVAGVGCGDTAARETPGERVSWAGPPLQATRSTANTAAGFVKRSLSSPGTTCYPSHACSELRALR